jgi:dipeptidase
LHLVDACTNFLVPAGSSVDGSTIITYNTDNPSRFGDVAHWPAGHHAVGELREVFDFDSGERLGAIPQPQRTWNVVGNTNEHQLSIGETTFGGLKMLDASSGPGVDYNTSSRVKAVCNATYGCIDYGSLIYLTLQRARTAREAISVADDLMQTYGYASSGESFSIADPTEVWVMEIMSKGNFSKGSVWVASRVPDGYVCAHANQARIRTFPRDKPDRALFSEDVVSFARSIGVFDGSDAEFSFSDVYDPVTFLSARYGEARVYSLFRRVAAPEENMDQYLDYVKGENLDKRMPLFVRVARKLSVNDSMWLMRDHYEGSWFDPTRDVGSGRYRTPYRLGAAGLNWEYEGKSYWNERLIGVEKTAINIIANQRPGHPYGVLWFGVDDPTFSVHTPLYGVTSRLPPAWDGGNCTGRAACREAFGLPGTITKFSLDAMHWVGQLVANFAYDRYERVAPDVHAKLAEIEARLFRAVRQMDTKLKALLSNSSDELVARASATNFSYSTAESLHLEWRNFWGELFAKHVDGYVTVPNQKNQLSGCDKQSSEFDESWKARIVAEAGDHYRVRGKENGHGDMVVDGREIELIL